MVSAPLIDGGMASCSSPVPCEVPGGDRLSDSWRFHRRGPDNFIDGFSGVERHRALNIDALAVR
jgi:hypothetical protein